MIVFDLRKIPKSQFDALGPTFFDSYVAGRKNPIFRALTLAVAGDTLDRSAKLPAAAEPIDLRGNQATAEQLEQARRFFQCALDDAALGAARFRRSRQFFKLVLNEVATEIASRESEADRAYG